MINFPTAKIRLKSVNKINVLAFPSNYASLDLIYSREVVITLACQELFVVEVARGEQDLFFLVYYANQNRYAVIHSIFYHSTTNKS